MTIILKSQPGMVTDPSDADRHEVEVALAKQMAEILQKFYPGHRWATFADTRQGIVWIAIPALMGPSLRFVIHGTSMETYPDMCKELRRAGGEILERYKLPRGECVLYKFEEALKTKAIKNHATPMPE